MVQVIPFLLVLSLALVAPGFSAKKCVLTGKWVNDLGSNMTIGPVDKEGKFSGSYLTAVKNTSDDICSSPLVGFQHNPDTCSRSITFGFTVNWKFSDSTSVFTGQCFVDKRGKETLKTMWLRRSHQHKIGDDWKATMVNTNTFTRLHRRDQSDVTGDCQADEGICDADPIYCPTTSF